MGVLADFVRTEAVPMNSVGCRRDLLAFHRAHRARLP
jgi:hypothetical protein